MKYSTHARVAQIEWYTKRIAALCAAGIAVSAFLYGTFLLIAVEHAATRSKVESQITMLSGEVSSLQIQYLSAMQSITPDRGLALGFVAPDASNVAYADASAPTLSLNNVSH